MRCVEQTATPRQRAELEILIEDGHFRRNEKPEVLNYVREQGPSSGPPVQLSSDFDRRRNVWWRRRELNPRPRKPAMKRLRCVSGSSFSVAAVRAGENSRFLVRLISALGSGPKPATYPAK